MPKCLYIFRHLFDYLETSVNVLILLVISRLYKLPYLINCLRKPVKYLPYLIRRLRKSAWPLFDCRTTNMARVVIL